MAGTHCVVIGAGLAGLAAAFRLLQNGWTVDVLESDDKRVGGRIFTRRFDRPGGTPLVYELGGEWIGDNHTRIKDLCAHFHLSLMDHRYSFAFWEKGVLSDTYEPGTSPFSITSQKAFKEFSDRMKNYNDCENKKLDKIDWWTKLRELGFSERELDHRDLMDSTDFGESIRHTSAFVAATEYVFSNRFDEMDKKIVGGNDLLPGAFAEAINKDGERIHLNSRVARVEQAKGRVVVTTHAGRQFVGDACICAVPASCLHKIHWHPPLPEDQRLAAEQLQYARIMKTAVLFSERLWPESKSGFSLFTNRASDFCFDSTFGQEGNERVICSYAIGDKADDLAEETDQDLARWIAEDVSAALGKTNITGQFLHRKEWQRDECIGGAYAFYRPGQWFKVRSALQRPHGRVAFAGEHLSEAWQGFMEGAIETGEAAAENL
jgi:monoamine oxidase